MARSPRAAWAEASRPTHLVLFRKKSEKNEEVLSNMVGDKTPVREGESRSGLLRFKPGRGKKSSAMLHEQLAVAEADITENEADDLRKDESVELVVRNEQRSLPRPVPSQPDTAVFGTAPGGALPLPGGMTDYLRGIRDLAELLLEGERAQFRPPVQTLEKQTEIDLTWGLSAVGLSQDSRYTGRGVKVAVLDTGLDLNHPDFRHIDLDNCESFVPGVDSVQDGSGHGTHCCGTVGGPARPARGARYGVAPDVELIVGKVLDDEGSGWDDQIIDGMIWAADRGAKVISMSLGSWRNTGTPHNQLYQTIAARLAEEGVLTVCAAGNDSQRPGLIGAINNPAACPAAMAVAALDVNLRVAWFSCGATDNLAEIDIAAPGVDVYSSWKGGEYRRIDGTSMATPHVAGAAALYLEQNPNLSVSALRQLLRERSRPIQPPRDFGSGLLQAP